MIEHLILVRHGETLHNVAGIAQGWQDSALSDNGRLQVERAAERLAAFRANALFSSPLQRALTTAQMIGDRLGLEVQNVEELREMNYGGWEGRSFLDVRRDDAEHYRRWVDDPEYPCPNGESHGDLLRRMQRAFERITSTATRAVVVTHGTAIRVGATALLNLPLSAARSLAQDNAAINHFIWRSDRFVLKLWNDTSHCLERGTMKDER